MAMTGDVLRRAILDAGLKYDPQLGALQGLRSERAQRYTRDRRVLASNARGITAAIDEAQPGIAGAFDQALASAGAQRAALGVGVADPQGQAYERRVGESKANALRDLMMEKKRTAAGQVYGGQIARQEYLADKGKIDDQLRGLLGEKGAFAVSRGGELQDKEADRAIRRRAQNITIRGQNQSHADRQASIAQREAAAAQRAATQDKAKAKGKVKWASPTDHAKARNDIEAARTYVRTLGPKIKSRAKLIQILAQGVPAGVDDDGGKLPAIPKFAPDYIRAALNIELDGSLSRGDLQRLHNGGLQLRRLGYPLRPPQGPRGNSAARLAGGGGGSGLSSRPPVPGLTR